MCYDVGYMANRAGKEEEKFKSRYEDSEILEKLKKIQHVSGFAHPQLPVITSERRDIIQTMSWGLIPHWARDEAYAKISAKNCLNAISEEVFEKNSYRDSITQRRCIIIVDALIEHYTLSDTKKFRHLITLKDESPMGLGGVWTSWKNKITGEEKITFSMLTTKANPLMAKIHNKKERMPFIVPDELIDKWLSKDLSRQEITELMGPYDESLMKAHGIKNKKKGEVMEEIQIPYKHPELVGILDL